MINKNNLLPLPRNIIEVADYDESIRIELKNAYSSEEVVRRIKDALSDYEYETYLPVKDSLTDAIFTVRHGPEEAYFYLYVQKYLWDTIIRAESFSGPTEEMAALANKVVQALLDSRPYPDEE